MSVSSREELKEYCFRSLGYPVVEINVADEQVDDRIDEAVAYYQINHYDGIQRVYLKHQLTSADITNQYISVNPLIYGVNYVIPIASGVNSGLFSPVYQVYYQDFFDLGSTSLIYYTQLKDHLQMIQTLLVGQILYRFNKLEGKVYLDIDWEHRVKEGDWLLFDCYRAIDPEVITTMYNDPWFKHYTTALIKKMWATNLKKFSGLALPGGVTIDGDKLYAEAMDEIDVLEKDLMTKMQPLGFMMG